MTDIEKLQFDYVWKWFAYHADQRMKAFNFMLVTFGILATAVATTLDKKLYLAATGLSFFSVVIALLFSRLDRRNRDLVRVGEGVLRQLEQDLIFASDGETSSVAFGLLTAPAPQTSIGRDGAPLGWGHDFLSGLLLGRHRIVLPAFAYLFALMFLLVLIAVRSGHL